MSAHESESRTPACQTRCVQAMSEPLGKAEAGRRSLRQRMKLLLKRALNPRVKRSLKARANRFVRLFSARTAGSRASPALAATSSSAGLKAGDLVRVRSREEVLATLDTWKEVKGCLFMPEMWAFCGTIQRVLKPVRRIVDERDYQVKKCKGVVLLEGVTCQGTELFGSCDRSCYFFWREEWLERAD